MLSAATKKLHANVKMFLKKKKSPKPCYCKLLCHTHLVSASPSDYHACHLLQGPETLGVSQGLTYLTSLAPQILWGLHKNQNMYRHRPST